MDENKRTSLTPEEENWLKEALTATPADNEAIVAQDHADLIHPDDLELEKILKEHREDPPAVEETPTPEPEIKMPEITDIPKTEPPKRTAPAAPVRRTGASTRSRQTRPAAKPAKTEKPKTKDVLGIPQFAATLIWLALIFVIGLSVGRTMWAACTDVFAFDKVEYTATITIDESDDIDDIAQMLHKAKMIRYPKLFTLFAELTGKDERISAGVFNLNSLLDYNAMINAMSANSASRGIVKVTFPEGYTSAQIFALLEEEGVCTVKQLEDCLKDKTVQERFQGYWFLEGVELGEPNCLEGYLFPDTYEFYQKDEPSRVLGKFLDAFDYRFTSRMQEKFENLQANSSLKLTMHEVIILASMIEKETSDTSESYDISAVYHNRLKRSGEFPYLDCDATTYYAIGDYFGTHGPLTEADLSVQSPYNTNWRGGHKGLPVGPICSPGADSIDAALSPSSNGYCYYVFNPKTGRHLFASTLSQHNYNVSTVG